MGYFFGKRGFLWYLCSVTKKQIIMETILILKHFKTGTFSVKNFETQDEAIQWWCSFSDTMEWEVIYIGTNKSTC